MSGTIPPINLTGPSTTPGAPLVTPTDINTAINAALSAITVALTAINASLTSNSRQIIAAQTQGDTTNLLAQSLTTRTTNVEGTVATQAAALTAVQAAIASINTQLTVLTTVTAPQAPTAIHSTGVTTTTIAAALTAPGAGSAPSSYQWYYRTPNGSGAYTIGPTSVGLTTTFTGLTPGLPYGITAAGVNSAGTGTQGTEATATTTAIVTEAAAGTSVTTVGPTINASPTPGVAGSGNLFAITVGKQISVNTGSGPVVVGGANVDWLYYDANHNLDQRGNGQWFGPITATSTGLPIANPVPGISAINVGGTTFTPGAASGTLVGAVSVVFNAGTFTGTLALTGTNASSFALSGSNIVTSGVLGAGTYNFNIVATQAGAFGSPFTRAVTVVSGASSATLLGAMVGYPGNSNYVTQSASFRNAMAPYTMGLLLHYLDLTQPASTWPGNAASNANGMKGVTTSANLVPCLAVPMTGGDSNSVTDFAAIAAGQMDGIYNGILDGFKNAGFTFMYIRPGWEFSGGWYKWSAFPANAANFIAAFQRIATLAHAYNGMTVKVVWNPAGGGGVVTANQSYPGDAYVDVVAIDIYGQEVSGSDNFALDNGGSPDSNNFSLLAAMAFAVAHNKGFGLGEVGAGANNSAYATNMAATIAASPSRPHWEFVGFWDDTSGGNGSLFWSDSATPAAAWKNCYAAMLANST